MKTHRVLLMILLALLLVVGIPAGLLMHEYHRERANHDLIVAIQQSDTSAALVALKAGADPNCREESTQESLSFTERMQQLVGKLLHPASHSDDRSTALELCLDNSEPEHSTILTALLDAGADPNLSGGIDYPPMIRAAASRHYTPILRLLLQHGGKPTQQDSHGRTALYYAVEYENMEALTLLLDAGGNINSQDEEGLTPLHIACIYCSSKAIPTLLQNHANLNSKSKAGKTPLDVAIGEQDDLMVKLLWKVGAKTSKELDERHGN